MLFVNFEVQNFFENLRSHMYTRKKEIHTTATSKMTAVVPPAKPLSDHELQIECDFRVET